MRKKYNADLYGEYPENAEGGPRRQEYTGRRPDMEAPGMTRPKRRLSDDGFGGIAVRHAGVDDRRGILPPYEVVDAGFPGPYLCSVLVQKSSRVCRSDS